MKNDVRARQRFPIGAAGYEESVRRGDAAPPDPRDDRVGEDEGGRDPDQFKGRGDLRGTDDVDEERFGPDPAQDLDADRCEQPEEGIDAEPG
jgi:hypothetical protein